MQVYYIIDLIRQLPFIHKWVSPTPRKMKYLTLVRDKRLSAFSLHVCIHQYSWEFQLWVWHNARFTMAHVIRHEHVTLWTRNELEVYTRNKNERFSFYQKHSIYKRANDRKNNFFRSFWSVTKQWHIKAASIIIKRAALPPKRHTDINLHNWCKKGTKCVSLNQNAIIFTSCNSDDNTNCTRVSSCIRVQYWWT